MHRKLKNYLVLYSLIVLAAVLAIAFDDGAKFHRAGNHNTRLSWNIIVLMVVIFSLVYIYRPVMLHIPYAYLWLGIVFVLLPSLTFLIRYPHLRSKLLDVTVYVFCLHLTLELVFLHLNLATYPGTHFIGWVELTGVRYPFEELVFWIGLCAIVTVSYYEVCIDMTDKALAGS